jgi:hypothetical protein
MTVSPFAQAYAGDKVKNSKLEKEATSPFVESYGKKAEGNMGKLPATGTVTPNATSKAK